MTTGKTNGRGEIGFQMMSISKKIIEKSGGMVGLHRKYYLNSTSVRKKDGCVVYLTTTKIHAQVIGREREMKESLGLWE